MKENDESNFQPALWPWRFILDGHNVKMKMEGSTSTWASKERNAQGVNTRRSAGARLATGME